MLTNESKLLNKNKYKIVKKFVYFSLSIVSIYTIWVTIARMEGKPPNIKIMHPPFVSKIATIPVFITDSGCGIKKVVITLFKDNLEIKLAEKKFYSSSPWNRSKQESAELQVTFSTVDYNLSDGAALLQVVAWDSSLRNYGKGNKNCMEMELQIDTCPPQISIIRSTKNINQGGSGVVVYKLSEPCLESGVTVEDIFFRGYPGHFEDESMHMAFFALDLAQDVNTRIFLSATDQSGNNSKAGFKYKILKKEFAQDDILLSNQFLNWKMPEFSNDFQNITNNTPINLFLKINNEMRKINGEKIRKICSKTEHKIMWDGPFLRLPRSENKAGFGDDRGYIYNDDIIDRQVHLGIDLASSRRSSVPAANSGKVVFSGNLGIYGNTIIIDHGFGIFSLYSHLSNIYVQENDMASKGSALGLTGETGLAGGDHLHFAIMISNTYANPVEWWDKTWLENNITSKIQHDKQREGKP